MLERADAIWSKGEVWAVPGHPLHDPPSSRMPQIYGCVFDDAFGVPWES